MARRGLLNSKALPMAKKAIPPILPGPSGEDGSRAFARCYWVVLEEGQAIDADRLLRKFARSRDEHDFIQRGTQLRLTHPQWDERKDVFSAAIFKSRRSGFPSVLRKKGVGKLGLKLDESLAYATCFAYSPTLGIAIAYVSQNGPTPRHIGAFVGELGFPGKIVVREVFRADVQERIEDASCITKASMKLEGIPQDSPPEDEPLLFPAFELARLFEGFDVTVTVSIGKSKNKSLALEAIKAMAGRCYMSRPDYMSELKLTTEEIETAAMAVLNVFSPFLDFVLQVIDTEREVNREDCRLKLIDLLVNHVPKVRKQNAP
jgi:hypothetical protein